MPTTQLDTAISAALNTTAQSPAAVPPMSISFSDPPPKAARCKARCVIRNKPLTDLRAYPSAMLHHLPILAGLLAAAVLLSAPTAWGSPQLVLSGTPYQPGLSNTLNFGSARLDGETVTHTLTIQNTGTSPLVFYGNPLVLISGTDPLMDADYTITAQPGVTVLQPSQMTNFTIRFDPSASGDRTSGLFIPSNAIHSSFQLLGKGLSSDARLGYLMVNAGGPGGSPMVLSMSNPPPDKTNFVVPVADMNTSYTVTAAAVDSNAQIYDLPGSLGPASGTASGTVFPAFMPLVSLRVVAEDFITVRTYQISFRQATVFDNWAGSHYLTINGTGAETDDPDKDGVVNLLEYATGQNPAFSKPLSTPLARTAGNLEFHYPRSVSAVNAGTTFIVEWSDGLGSSSWSTTGVTQQVLSDNGTQQQVKATIPAGSGGKRFVRLRVNTPTL